MGADLPREVRGSDVLHDEAAIARAVAHRIHMRLDFGERQIAFGLCCGMSNEQMADALGVAKNTVAGRARHLMEKTGMANRIEFALQQNARVREQIYGEPGPEFSTAETVAQALARYRRCRDSASHVYVWMA